MGRLSSGLLTLGVAAVAVAAAASMASAADLPAAPAYNPPPIYRPALYDWTGFYFGGHVGMGMMEDSVTAATTTALQPAGTRTQLSPYGVIGGVQAGFNLEFAPFVIGVEGTWTASPLSGSQLTPSLIAATSETSTSASHWYYTAAGRVGYAANDWLLYAKGGAAWMRVDYTQDIGTGAGIVTTQTIATNRNGYIVGGGIEYGFTENLSGKIEYEFLDFGTHTYNFNALASVVLAPLPVAIKSNTHLFSVGMNYRFNWGGGGAVVAKY